MTDTSGRPKKEESVNVRHNPIPVAPGFEPIYAHAVETPAQARTLYVSGQIGVAADGSVPGSFDEQFRLAIANLEAVLRGSNLALEDVTRLTFYLTRTSDLPILRDIRRELLAISPAVTVLVVSALAGPDLLVEVEAVAAAA
jgi:enamine deaminase RidA (YjgF/YER057c/UK114 family)